MMMMLRGALRLIISTRSMRTRLLCPRSFRVRDGVPQIHSLYPSTSRPRQPSSRKRFLLNRILSQIRSSAHRYTACGHIDFREFCCLSSLSSPCISCCFSSFSLTSYLCFPSTLATYTSAYYLTYLSAVVTLAARSLMLESHIFRQRNCNRVACCLFVLAYTCVTQCNRAPLSCPSPIQTTTHHAIQVQGRAHRSVRCPQACLTRSLPPIG